MIQKQFPLYLEIVFNEKKFYLNLLNTQSYLSSKFRKVALGMY